MEVKPAREEKQQATIMLSTAEVIYISPQDQQAFYFLPCKPFFLKAVRGRLCSSRRINDTLVFLKRMVCLIFSVTPNFVLRQNSITHINTFEKNYFVNTHVHLLYFLHKEQRKIIINVCKI